MKRIFYILPLLAIVWGGSCTNKGVDEMTFTVRTEVIHSDMVIYRVYPQYNDFYYASGAISVAEYNSKTPEQISDSLYQDQLDIYHWVCEYYKEQGQKAPGFEEAMLWQCGNVIYAAALKSETNYYIWNMRFDDKLRPISKLHLTPFRTSQYVHSDITFDIQSVGTKLYVNPSNQDTYFWEYATKKEIDKNYYGSPYTFYSEVVTSLEFYHILSPLLSQGKDSDNVADYYNLKDNDTIYLAAAAFQNETSSEVSTFELVYKQGEFSIQPYIEEPTPEAPVRRKSLRQDLVLPRSQREASARLQRCGGSVQ